MNPSATLEAAKAIPEDLIEQARKLFLDEHLASCPKGMVPTNFMLARTAEIAIARAILAERERCALVADSLPIAAMDRTNSTSHELSFAVGAMAQRDSIAKQIRGEA